MVEKQTKSIYVRTVKEFQETTLKLKRNFILYSFGLHLSIGQFDNLDNYEDFLFFLKECLPHVDWLDIRDIPLISSPFDSIEGLEAAIEAGAKEHTQERLMPRKEWPVIYDALERT